MLAAPALWLANLATGQLAAIVATIAIAVVGLLMLDGRLDWRRGSRVLLGCFLIFGAGTISSAFSGSGKYAHSEPDSSPQNIAPPDSPITASNDPWAAASLKPDSEDASAGR